MTDLTQLDRSTIHDAAQTDLEFDHLRLCLPAVNSATILAMLQREVAKAGGQREFARQRGISAATVSRTLSGDLAPDATIANSLGFMMRPMFFKIRSGNDVG